MYIDHGYDINQTHVRCLVYPIKDRYILYMNRWVMTVVKNGDKQSSFMHNDYLKLFVFAAQSQCYIRVLL